MKLQTRPDVSSLAKFLSNVVRLDHIGDPLEPLTEPHGLIPLRQIPRARTTIATSMGVETNIIFKTWGGLGDQICAEPTLRFAADRFPKDGCNVSLASEHPELFEHIKFTNVFDLKECQPNYDKYFPFETIQPPNTLVWQFFGHMLVNCVDFPSQCALRMQLPIAEKEIHLSSKKPDDSKFTPEELEVLAKPYICVHPGRHWQSKTYPKWFWDRHLKRMISAGKVPVIIGANTDDNRGTVDIDPTGCVDLRNRLSIAESVWLLQHAAVLTTNDSAPLHMAASGDAWIGYVATCKHPDLITHWRHGQWSWKMQNHGKGGIWEVTPYCPNKMSTYEVENVGDKLLEWLPNPEEFAEWALQKLDA